MKYIASWSGGKDSTASIILAHEHNEPLDLIIFAEVMFDNETSGELPEHIQFVKSCIPIFESWGYPVKILHSKKTYMDCFHHRTVRGKRVGMKKGFVMIGRCDVQRDCKLKPIHEFWDSMTEEFTQYIGMAIDEPLRIGRIVKTKNQVSLLQKYRYTEEMAYELCQKYEMLSPIYNFAPRGGCWFCPNAKKPELRRLYDCHKDLFNRLVELEHESDLIGDVWDTLHRKSISDIAKSFADEDAEMARLYWKN